MDNNLYNAYIDNKLTQLDSLDNEIQADPAFGSDYAFIFQYIYPRIYELRNTDNRFSSILDKIGGVL